MIEQYEDPVAVAVISRLEARAQAAEQVNAAVIDVLEKHTRGWNDRPTTPANLPELIDAILTTNAAQTAARPIPMIAQPPPDAEIALTSAVTDASEAIAAQIVALVPDPTDARQQQIALEVVDAYLPDDRHYAGAWRTRYDAQRRQMVLAILDAFAAQAKEPPAQPAIATLIAGGMLPVLLAWYRAGEAETPPSVEEPVLRVGSLVEMRNNSRVYVLGLTYAPDTTDKPVGWFKGLDVRDESRIEDYRFEFVKRVLVRGLGGEALLTPLAAIQRAREEAR